MSGLHRILQYMCAYLQLGGESEWSGDLSHGRKEFGGAWGGTEGIGTHTCWTYSRSCCRSNSGGSSSNSIVVVGVIIIQ